MKNWEKAANCESKWDVLRLFNIDPDAEWIPPAPAPRLYKAGEVLPGGLNWAITKDGTPGCIGAWNTESEGSQSKFDRFGFWPNTPEGRAACVAAYAEARWKQPTPGVFDEALAITEQSLPERDEFDAWWESDETRTRFSSGHFPIGYMGHAGWEAGIARERERVAQANRPEIPDSSPPKPTVDLEKLVGEEGESNG